MAEDFMNEGDFSKFNHRRSEDDDDDEVVGEL